MTTPNADPVRWHWDNAHKVGGCNFCHRKRLSGPFRVLVVRGNMLEVRFCNACLADLPPACPAHIDSSET